MADEIIFHPLVQGDLSYILGYYEDEAGVVLADRFYDAFISTAEKALANPKRFHPIHLDVRRANIPKFPYHFLYRKTETGIRVLVLRHHKRHPSFGLRRK